MVVRQLPIIRIGKKSYFVDLRLNEIRNVKNPNDRKAITPELIDVLIKNIAKR
jgi:hypothetical protein